MPTVQMNANSVNGVRRKNVFILGYDEQHQQDVKQIYNPEHIRIHGLLHSTEIVNQDEYDIDGLLDKARAELDRFDTVDGIVCHWDFPGTSLQSILCEEYGLPGPSLAASLKCAHKYWSRVEQKKVVPENTPQFCAVDPFDDRALEKITLDFPFWLKPIKGYGSMLGFHVTNEEDFRRALEQTRGTIESLGDPFNDILHRVELPAELDGIGGNALIAEEYITGVEFAPEGFVRDGKFHVHGVIDMVFGPNGKSFERYEYPSRVPESTQNRATAVTEKLMEHLGFDNGCFNIEFFWNEKTDRLYIIEINPRISQSHSYQFEMVNGLSNHEVAIKVAVGEEPHFELKDGPYECAAKFLHRHYDKQNMIAKRIPEPPEIAAFQHRLQPDTVVRPRLQKGMQLGDMKEQDPYSFVIADIMIAAHSREELEKKYREAAARLPFHFEPVGDEKSDGAAGKQALT